MALCWRTEHACFAHNKLNRGKIQPGGCPNNKLRERKRDLPHPARKERSSEKKRSSWDLPEIFFSFPWDLLLFSWISGFTIDNSVLYLAEISCLSLWDLNEILISSPRDLPRDDLFSLFFSLAENIAGKRQLGARCQETFFNKLFRSRKKPKMLRTKGLSQAQLRGAASFSLTAEVDWWSALLAWW